MPKSRDIEVLNDGFTRNQSRADPAIATARARMTATELKAFYQVSTLIKMDDTDFREYEISVKDFCQALQLNDSNREFVVKLCRKLLRQVFEVEQENGDYLGYTIFSKMHYKHKEQRISIKFNDDMRPYLLELKRYTKIHQVKYITAFDSVYAIRIYALLKDYRLLSYRDINLDALSKMLDLPKSYKDFGQIERKVLEPAIREINAKSDIEIYSIEPIEKQRKKIISIRVNFGNKSDARADDVLKYLQALYKKSNGDLSIFYGFFFSISSARSKGDLYRITKIEVDDRPYYTAYSGNDVIFAVMGKKDFAARLIDGIYNALIFTAESEKKNQLDLDQWQTAQDNLAQIKKIAKEWEEQGNRIKY